MAIDIEGGHLAECDTLSSQDQIAAWRQPLEPITLVPQRVSPARLEAWRLFWAELLAPHNTEAPVGDTEASKNSKPGFADQAAPTTSIPTRQRRKSQ